MTNKLKLLFIIALALIIPLVAVLVLSNLKPSSSTHPSGLITPTSVITNSLVTPTLIITPTASYQSVVQKQTLADLMPVTSDEYNIEYLATSDTIMVTIKNSPFDANKKLAEKWFVSKGVTDISTLPILWNKYRGVE